MKIGVVTLEGNEAVNDFGSGSPFSDQGLSLSLHNELNSILTSNGCEYGMYDHSDTSNAYLLGQGWSLLTFTELSGSCKDDFIEYFNTNGGIYSLLTWSSSNCCFAYGELTDTRLRLTTGDTGSCYVYPAIGSSYQCNPSGGYPQGTLYNFFSYGACHNGQLYIYQLTGNNVTFSTTTICATANNPGIWKRCANSTTNAGTTSPTTGLFFFVFVLFCFVLGFFSPRFDNVHENIQ